jgi:hypothetical protein
MAKRKNNRNWLVGLGSNERKPIYVQHCAKNEKAE